MTQVPRFPTAADLAQCAHDLGVSIPSLCKRAGVTPSTFYRWRNGDFEINLTTARQFQAALEAAEREKMG